MSKAEFIPSSHCILLSNANGIRVKLTPIGASIVEVIVPDAQSCFQNIALSLPLNRYGHDPSYAGATLGPHAGRIPNGKLSLGNNAFSLSQNEKKHHLHGGFHNFSTMTWDIFRYGNDDSSSFVTFYLLVPDQLEGYPGLRHIQTHYRLDDANRLSIHFSTKSDKPTHFNLSNHTYWNLGANMRVSALNQTLQLHASHVWLNDPDFLARELIDVQDTPFDFQRPKRLSASLACCEHPQLQAANGYNHSFLLTDTHAPAAILHDESSRRTLKLFTDYPCVVLYTGGFLDQHTQLADGSSASSGCGIALEAQERPMSQGHRHIQPILPGETWERQICYAFEID